MVKGLTRRVIVIKSPDHRLFDEAIFIVKEDALHASGVSSDDIVKEAEAVAGSYVQNNLKSKKFPNLPAPLFTFAGAAITALVWFLTQFIR